MKHVCSLVVVALVGCTGSDHDVEPVVVMHSGGGGGGIDPSDPSQCQNACKSTTPCGSMCMNLGQRTTCEAYGVCAPSCGEVCSEFHEVCAYPCESAEGGMTTCGAIGWCDAEGAYLWARVDRVRHCTPGPLCDSQLTLPDYVHWDNHGVAHDKQKETYLARISDPPVSATKHVVFVAAGQQFGSGAASELAGSFNGFKDDYDADDGWRWYLIGDHTLPHKLTRGGAIHQLRERDETFVATAWDPRFNHDFSVGNKSEIEGAYYDWLNTKFDPARIESIFLVGHSRGGCLVARLAKRFAAELPGVPVVVSLHDPVCNYEQGELGLVEGFNVNPLNSEYKARRADLSAQFPVTANLRVLALVGGQAVVWGLLGVRAFSGLTAASIASWFEHQWRDLPHDEFDSSADAHLAYHHLRDACWELGCL